jgi:L-ascorbate metabolism protein UlaG (beta-lactamase superfamily)
MSLKFRWLGNACFEMILPSGKVLVLDPYIDYAPNAPIKSTGVTGADYIVLTHGHFDHCSDTGNLAHKFNSRVICSHDIAGQIAEFFDLDPHSIIRTSAGDTLDFDDLKIEVKRSIHASTVPMLRATYRRLTGERPDPGMSPGKLREAIAALSAGQPEPPAAGIRNRMETAGIVGGEQLNYIFQTGDNLRSYVYGANPEDYLWKQIMEAEPNIIFLQLTSKPEEVAEIAALSGAEIIVPTHHDIAGPEAAHKSAQETAKHLAELSSARFIDTEYGRWYEVGVTISPE